MTGTRLVATSLLLLFALCTACGSSDTPLPGPTWGEPIALVPELDVNFVHFTADGKLVLVAADSVYLTTVDGVPPTKLFTQPGVKRAVLSPDGKTVVFDDNKDIFVANADGSDIKPFANDPDLFEFASSIHPEGKLIVYVTINDAKQEYGIWRRNLDGSDPQNLVATQGVVLRHTRWSPDGSRISYFAIEEGKASVELINADGSERTRIPRVTDFERQPSWSPDGTEFVYSSMGDEKFALWVMKIDGSDRRLLTEMQGDLAKPGFSPDGNTIVFVCSKCSGDTGSLVYVVQR